MTNHKKTPHYAVSWWLWNGETFERHEMEAEAVEIAKCGKYRFFRTANPVENPKPGREWLIAEGGTGYVLAHRPCSKWRVGASSLKRKGFGRRM